MKRNSQYTRGSSFEAFTEAFGFVYLAMTAITISKEAFYKKKITRRRGNPFKHYIAQISEQFLKVGMYILLFSKSMLSESRQE